MKQYSIKIKTVDDYISCQPIELRPMLVKIRSLIESAVPEAEEVISYQIPCYKYHGMLVGFGTHKKGCSFYTMNPQLLVLFSKELKGLEYTGSTMHLDPQLSLPVVLLKKIIKQRIKENLEKVKEKKLFKLKK